MEIQPWFIDRCVTHMLVDLYILCILEELMWQKLDDEKSPQLSYHSAVVHQKAVWIHGGTPRSGISSNTWRLSFGVLDFLFPR
jgi:hypothetical protein